MVEIKSFKGVRYNKEKVGDYSLVITPPYDVIDGKEKEEFCSLSLYNMVRLLLGCNGEYAQVTQLFKEWQEENVLEQDEQDSVYVYSQKFRYNGGFFTRTGFISLVKLEDLGKGVLPHEKTLEKPLQDRLALLESTRANFGTVFALYDDNQHVMDALMKDKMDNKEPNMDFWDKFGINHRLWRISDEYFIDRLKKEMSKYQCVIADGHHRYKSALKFKNEHPELREAQYIMCCFVNSFDEGLFILPIDRFVFNLQNIDIEEILAKLKEYFETEETEDVGEMIRKVDNTLVMIDKAVNLKNHVFGMYCYLNKKSYFLKLKLNKNNNILDKYYPDDTDVYKKLDINILHKIVFEEILKISEEDQFKGTNIEYTKGSKRALDKLIDDKYQFAFFIKAPLMREIFLTARAGVTMPQKSTYFYPKIYSGLVINKISK